MVGMHSGYKLMDEVEWEKQKKPVDFGRVDAEDRAGWTPRGNSPKQKMEFHGRLADSSVCFSTSLPNFEIEEEEFNAPPSLEKKELLPKSWSQEERSSFDDLQHQKWKLK